MIYYAPRNSKNYSQKLKKKLASIIGGTYKIVEKRTIVDFDDSFFTSFWCSDNTLQFDRLFIFVYLYRL